MTPTKLPRNVPERRQTSRRKSKLLEGDSISAPQPEFPLTVPSINKTTMSDLTFAETYLDYVSRRSTPENRARAKILMATMQMLDVRHPDWRKDLLLELSRLGIGREVQDLFPLPAVDSGELFESFLNTVIKGK